MSSPYANGRRLGQDGIEEELKLFMTAVEDKQSELAQRLSTWTLILAMWNLYRTSTNSRAAYLSHIASSMSMIPSSSPTSFLTLTLISHPS